MNVLRSRVGLAVIGLLLVGGVSAAIAILTTPHPLPASLNAVAQRATATHAVGVTSAAATATAAAQPAATDTTGAVATTPPTPRPTPLPTATFFPGQSVGVVGQVESVNASASSFVLATRGSQLTITVNGSTSWSGTAKKVSDIFPGWVAEVHGTVQPDGSILATEVNANPDQ